MTGAESDAVRAALEDALRREAPRATAGDLDTAARSIAATASNASPNRFYIDPKGAVTELDEALKALDRLQLKLVALHGVTRAEIDVAAGRNRKEYEPSVYGQLTRLHDDLSTARKLVSQKGFLHAPPRSRAQHVAEAVAYWLAKLTGRAPGVSHDSGDPTRPNRPTGPLVRVIAAAFTASGVTENVESEAKKAAADWKQTYRQRGTAS